MLRRKTAAKKKNVAAPRHLDRRGIAFEDRHLLVPPRMDQWPSYPPRVRDDNDKLQAAFHFEFAVDRTCWLCGKKNHWDTFELHHMAAGSRGRSHERELFTYLCKPCHQNVTPADLGKLLWAKWKFDNAWTDWELLTIRHGWHLPDLEMPEWCEK